MLGEARRVAVAALAAGAAASCGGSASDSPAATADCIKRHLPSAVRDGVAVGTTQGVTSLHYVQHGGEVDISVFETAAEAVKAEEAEARIGDAHDRRIENVLYSGGRDVRAVVARCVG